MMLLTHLADRESVLSPLPGVDNVCNVNILTSATFKLQHVVLYLIPYFFNSDIVMHCCNHKKYDWKYHYIFKMKLSLH